MRRSLGIALGLTFSVLGPLSAAGAPELGLGGSHTSMAHQNEIARENAFAFLRNDRQVESLIAQGSLIPMYGNADYRLANVSHPAARPATKTFVERLGKAYHTSCGDPLVVTSLTRPLNEQPRNASGLSVHPAGMAVDLRIPARPSCRGWLEAELLYLEQRGVLDVTRERRPAHYHVAVFPEAYTAYVAPIIVVENALVQAASASAALASTLDAAAAKATAELPKKVVAPATASVGPGPGVFTTLLYAVILLSGMTALLIAIRGEPAPKPVPVMERRDNGTANRVGERRRS